MHSVHRVKLFIFLWISETTTLPFAVLIDSFFVTEMESVYCAVRTGCLYKTDYLSSLKGQLSIDKATAFALYHAVHRK
jgi:hypothetical protein